MDKEEIYLDRLENRRIAMTSYESLVDCAEVEAYDELTDYIHDAMPLLEAQDYLLKIATIWQGREPTAEKYSLVSDVFQKIIDHNTDNKMRG